MGEEEVERQERRRSRDFAACSVFFLFCFDLVYCFYCCCFAFICVLSYFIFFCGGYATGMRGNMGEPGGEQNWGGLI